MRNRSYVVLTLISVVLLSAIIVLCLEGQDVAAAIIAGVCIVETMTGLALWWWSRRSRQREAGRVLSSWTAVYVYDRERVIGEMDTCRFPRVQAADPPDGFAAMTYHLGYEAGAASVGSRS